MHIFHVCQKSSVLNPCCGLSRRRVSDTFGKKTAIVRQFDLYIIPFEPSFILTKKENMLAFLGCVYYYSFIK